MQIITAIVLATQAGTRYFSSGAYLSRPGDTPALHPFESRLFGRITYSREVDCITWDGGQSSGGIGAIELRNDDGALDDLLFEDSAKGARLRIYEGTPTDAFADFELTHTARVARIEPQGERVVRIVTRSLMDRLDERPLQDQLYGPGDDVIEQVELLPRPIAIGHPLSCPIVLVDNVDYLYDCHDSDDFGGVSVVRDAGYPLDESVGYVEASGLGRYGIEKLALPVGKVVADVLGATVDAVVIERLPEIVHYIAVTRGGLDPSEIDTASIAALDAACPWTLSYWADRAVTCGDALREIADSFSGWVYENAAGQLAFGRLEVPAEEDAVLTITESMLVEGTELGIDPDTADGFSRVVNGARNWYQHGAAEIVDGVSEADRAALVAQYRVRAISTAALCAEVDRHALRARQPRNGREDEQKLPEIGIGTLLDEQTACQDLADHIAALYPEGAVPRFLRLEVKLSPAQRALLDCGRVVVVRNRRYGLAAGRAGVVKAIAGAHGEASHTLKIWTSMEAA